MNLKRIEMVGFKSFADYQKIDFEDGVVKKITLAPLSAAYLNASAKLDDFLSIFINISL